MYGHTTTQKRERSFRKEEENNNNMYPPAGSRLFSWLRKADAPSASVNTPVRTPSAKKDDLRRERPATPKSKPSPQFVNASIPTFKPTSPSFQKFSSPMVKPSVRERESPSPVAWSPGAVPKATVPKMTVPTPRFTSDMGFTGCICFRQHTKVVCCKCGLLIEGRVRIQCPDHPNTIHLMDVERCPECHSSTLTELRTT